VVADCPLPLRISHCAAPESEFKNFRLYTTVINAAIQKNRRTGLLLKSGAALSSPSRATHASAAFGARWIPQIRRVKALPHIAFNTGL
jgi:hypothetical protein